MGSLSVFIRIAFSLTLFLCFCNHPIGAQQDAPTPQPSSTVQMALNMASSLGTGGRYEEAIRQTNRTIVQAERIQDTIGVANGYVLLGLIGEKREQKREAVTAWRSASEAFSRARFLPGAVGSGLQGIAIQITLDNKDAKQWLLSLTRLSFGTNLWINGTANAWNDGGVKLFNAGYTDEALTCYQVALLLLKDYPKAHANGILHNNMGAVYHRKGNILLAETEYKTALAFYLQNAKNSLPLADTYSNLGEVAEELGNYPLAEQRYRLALSIREKQVPDSAEVADTLLSLGNIAFSRRDLPAAQSFYTKALEILSERAPNSLAHANALTHTADLLAERKDPTAEARYLEALKIVEQKEPNSLRLCTLLNSIGAFKRKTGEYDKAKAYLERSLEIVRKVSPNSTIESNTLTNLANIAVKKKEWKHAEELYRQSLDIQRQYRQGHFANLPTLYSLGLLMAKQSRWIEAESYLRQAQILLDNEINTLNDDVSTRAIAENYRHIPNLLALVLLQLKKTNEGFQILEEGRARSFTQMLSDRRLFSVQNLVERDKVEQARAVRDRALDTLQRRNIALRLANVKLARAKEEKSTPQVIEEMTLAQATSQVEQKSAETAYISARLTAENLWREYKQSLPAVFKTSKPILEAIATIPVNCIYLAYGNLEDYTLLFVAERNKPLRVYTLALSTAELEKQVENLRAELVVPSNTTDGLVKQSRELYQSLIPQEEMEAIRVAKRVVIAPDGALWKLPFGALVTNVEGKPTYFGIAKPLVYANSLSLWLEAEISGKNSDPSKSGRMVFVGDPIFALPNSPETNTKLPVISERGRYYIGGKPPAPLQGTRTEVESISRLYFGNAQNPGLLIGAAATEANLRKHLQEARIIHLATHGFLAHNAPLASGVLLTPPSADGTAEQTDNDGILQAWEVFGQMKLQADLTVLSACESGRGEIARAEGVIGMTRALQYAGSRSVIASLWKVSDASTAKLMIAFHSNLRKGTPKDESLRLAMQEVSSASTTAHPYYWASFFLTGSGR